MRIFETLAECEAHILQHCEENGIGLYDFCEAPEAYFESNTTIELQFPINGGSTLFVDIEKIKANKGYYMRLYTSRYQKTI